MTLSFHYDFKVERALVEGEIEKAKYYCAEYGMQERITDEGKNLFFFA